MKMRRPVVPVMAVMHHVVEVVSVKAMRVMKVAAKKSMTESAKAAETMRHSTCCRERDGEQTDSGDW